MSSNDPSRLSQLATNWTLLARAHAGGDPGHRAMAELLPRYCSAVYRYLLALVGDEAAAEELGQEFAYRFVRGEFRHADPGKGRFRDYVKVSVLHLVSEHRRRARRDGRFVPFDSRVRSATAADDPDPDDLFRHEWAATLLDRGWNALRRHAEETGQLLYDALKLRADDPDRRSAAIAEALAAKTGRSFSPPAVRQLLHRAREKYAELLWREVAESIRATDPEVVKAELAELGLLTYCEPLLNP